MAKKDHAGTEPPDPNQAVEPILGYLNFSSGAPDRQLLLHLDQLYREIPEPVQKKTSVAARRRQPPPPPATPRWQTVVGQLQEGLQRLQRDSAAFEDSRQAERVLERVPQVVTGYLEFHEKLIGYLAPDESINAFMLGRMCEAVLAQGPDWDDRDRVVEGAIRQLGDFVGHRPVPTLETRKHEPYRHEWIRPVPLYVRDVGVAWGPYAEVMERALKILADTDESIRHQAHLDLEALDELAMDPRSFDFDHPANKRPNYHFGMWDPHQIDNRGRYHRFVVQRVALEALSHRLRGKSRTPKEELLFEAGSVLAGIILMAAGTSGRGPEAFDSTTTLGSLLPGIAQYRDAFYEQLLEKCEGKMGTRLRNEARKKRQPFGSARQHLNAQLAQMRARQLEHVQLARLFARMNRPETARRQVDDIPVASARMQTESECLLVDASRLSEENRFEESLETIRRAYQTLLQGIESGAIIDPWNILGFDAHYSLFPAAENAVHDHRADELIEYMEEMFAVLSRLWGAAAVADEKALTEQIRQFFRETADWWRQFATHQVSSVEGFDADDVFRAGEQVSAALQDWNREGGRPADLQFWARHANSFDSPQAYTLVIDALLDAGDPVASMALLTHWLNQSDRIPLEHGESSFHRLAERWMLAQLDRAAESGDDAESDDPGRGPLARKLFDYLEANAEAYWQVPSFELGALDRASDDEDLSEEVDEAEESTEDGLYQAAYEDMVYRDSTDDGIEGDVFDTGPAAVGEDLQWEADRLAHRLAFHATLARLWKLVAVHPELVPEPSENADSEAGNSIEVMQRWIEQASENHRELLDLARHVHAYAIAAPSVDQQSMLDYDRRRTIKDALMERILRTTAEMADAERLLVASLIARGGDPEILKGRADDERTGIRMLVATMRGDRDGARAVYGDFRAALRQCPLLYVPLNRAGDPTEIVKTRNRQRLIYYLLEWMPRLGLLEETGELLETARYMEKNHPVGAGAVTEFDELYRVGWTALVEALICSVRSWSDEIPRGDKTLVTLLERFAESMLISWLTHSQTLRLSVMERVRDDGSWDQLVQFIQRYGGDLFTQQYLNLGNVRAILHQGVDQWIDSLEQEEIEEVGETLRRELGIELQPEEAFQHLSLILEAIVENYGEYRDYNSTTTQSDHGELIYTLLDFLRLRSDYDRICWKLRPVIMAHEVLVRRGQSEAAAAWRRALRDRTRQESEAFLTRLRRLQRKYGMRMPTIADRIGERFVRQMDIDRIRALVEAAVYHADPQRREKAFRELEQQAGLLARHPTGAGLDLPPWLMALEEEVESLVRAGVAWQLDQRLTNAIPVLTLDRANLERQLDNLCQKARAIAPHLSIAE